MQITKITQHELETSTVHGDIYACIARHVKAVSSGQSLFHTSVTMTMSFFRENLAEEDIQWMNCRCCRNFFKAYGNLVYIDDNGVLVSALWRDVDGVTEAQSKFFNAIADKVEAGQIKAPLNLDEIDEGADIMLGVDTAGGEPHYHALLSDDIIPVSVKLFTDTNTALCNLVKAYKGFSNLVSTMTTFAALFKEDQRVPATLRELFALDIDLMNHIYDVYEVTKSINATTAHLTSLVNMPEKSDFTGLIPTLVHWNGSILGTVVKLFRDGVEYDTIIAKLLDMSDINKYKAKDVKLLRERELAEGRKFIEDGGYIASMTRELAPIAYLGSIWEGVNEEVVASPFDKVKTVDSAPTTDLPETKHPIRISIGKFLETILPTAVEIAIKLPMSGAYTVFTKPIEDDTPPIFFWDTVDNRKPWCTCMPQTPVRTVDQGLVPHAMQVIDKIVTLPWMNVESKQGAALGDGYLFTFTQQQFKKTSRLELSSYGAALCNTLAPHSRVVDSVIPHLPVTVRDDVAIALPFGGSRDFTGVRVNDGTAVRWYDIFAIE